MLHIVQNFHQYITMVMTAGRADMEIFIALR